MSDFTWIAIGVGVYRVALYTRPEASNFTAFQMQHFVMVPSRGKKVERVYTCTGAH